MVDKITERLPAQVVAEVQKATAQETTTPNAVEGMETAPPIPDEDMFYSPRRRARSEALSPQPCTRN